jgi:hypothetical protein
MRRILPDLYKCDDPAQDLHDDLMEYERLQAMNGSHSERGPQVSPTRCTDCGDQPGTKHGDGLNLDAEERADRPGGHMESLESSEQDEVRHDIGEPDEEEGQGPETATLA